MNNARPQDAVRDTAFGPADCEDARVIDYDAMEQAQLEKAANMPAPKARALPVVEEVSGPDPELMRALDDILKRAGTTQEKFFKK